MKRYTLFVALVLLLFVGLPAQAQKTEIFIGYSYNVNGAGKFTRENAQGYTANYTSYFTNFFGLTTDFGGTYGKVKDLTQLLAAPSLLPSFAGTNFGSYQFMLGPRIAIRRRWFTPFFQALVGVAVTTQQSFAVALPGQPTANLPLCSPTLLTNCSVPSKIETDIAVGGGAGLDFNLIRYFGIRLAQVDYVPVRAQDPATGQPVWRRNIRARAGLVVRW